MELTFYWNSFIEVEHNGRFLLCDPWINEVFKNCGWKPNRCFNRVELVRHIRQAEYIYISHLHYDHFDRLLLKEVMDGLDRGKITFIIPELRNSHLRDSLSAVIGDRSQLVSLSPFETLDIWDGEYEVTLIPQMDETSSQANGIGYDMDSSIIVHDKMTKDTFFNQVDNPLSVQSLARIKEVIPYPRIDIATFTGGSASQYPQSFLGIDRLNERMRLQNICYEKLTHGLSVLGPTHFVICGGSYEMADGLEYLSDYKVVVDDEDLKKAGLETCINYVDINASPTISLEDATVKLRGASSAHQRIIDGTESSDRYSWRSDKERVVSHKTDDAVLLDRAYKNCAKVVDSLGSVSNLSVDITLHAYVGRPNTINKDHVLSVKDTPVYSYEMALRKGKTEDCKTRIYEYHIDREVLMACISSEASWNTILTSSSVFIQREPNLFFPVDEQLLNFFRL